MLIMFVIFFGALIIAFIFNRRALKKSYENMNSGSDRLRNRYRTRKRRF